MKLQKLNHSLLLASVRRSNWNNRKCSRGGTPTNAQSNDGIWGTCVCSLGLPPSQPTPHKGSGASHQILGIWDRDGLKGSKLDVGSNFMLQLGEASWPTWNMKHVHQVKPAAALLSVIYYDLFLYFFILCPLNIFYVWKVYNTFRTIPFLKLWSGFCVLFVMFAQKKCTGFIST